MKREDLLRLYSRLGLVVAAFTLIIGIIGSPALPRIWPPSVMVAQAKAMFTSEADGGKLH